MKASNIFKFFIRLLFVAFITTFLAVYFSDNSNIENFDQKLQSLGNTGKGFATADSNWKELDKNMSAKQIKVAIKLFGEGKIEKSKEALYKAKLLAADLQEAPLFIKISNTELAIKNALTLKSGFKKKDQINLALVQIINSSGSPLIVGHIIKKSNLSMQVRDLDGFINTVLISGSSVTKLSEDQKIQHYKEMFETIKSDNGVTNSYGIYQSANWAYKHKLEKDVNKTLLSASLNDINIINTIFDENAKKVLRIAVWSKIIGNYEAASTNANIIVKEYSTSKYVEEANKILADINDLKLKAQAKSERRREAMAIATDRKRNKILEEKKRKDLAARKEKLDKTPINTLQLVGATTEPIKIDDNPKPTKLVLIEKDTGDITTLPPEEENELPPEEAEEDFQDGVFADSKFKAAKELVKEARKIMKKAMSYQNPGHKKAQINFKKAKKVYQKASKLLNKIARKYENNEDFLDLAGQANGGIFFLNKSCIRH